MSPNRQQARGGMGSHKHGVSGRSGKSPRFRHWLKRETERQEHRKKAPIKNPKATVKELFNES